MTNNQRLRLAEARDRRKATLESIAEAMRKSRTEIAWTDEGVPRRTQVISE